MAYAVEGSEPTGSAPGFESDLTAVKLHNNHVISVESRDVCGVHALQCINRA